MASKDQLYRILLEKKQKQARYRQLKSTMPLDDLQIETEDKALLNFGSLDFLGLAQHPFVKKTTIKYVLKWGSGSSLSRLVSSHLEQQRALEKELAERMRKEAAFFLSPLPNIHELTLTPLGTADVVFFIDEKVALPLKKAAMQSKATIISFSHNSLSHLTALLTSHKESPKAKVIITESIFHLTGDIAPLRELCDTAKTHDALLYVDDSLSFSLYGHQGYGLGLEKQGVDIAVSSMCHLGGTIAHFIVTTSLLKEFLLSAATDISPFSLLPPAALGCIEAAFELIPDMHEERSRIPPLTQEMREVLKHLDIPSSSQKTHILPIPFQEEKVLTSFFRHCINEKILVQNLKSMGMTKEGIIRVIITAEHAKEQLKTIKARLSLWQSPLLYEKAL